MNTSIAKDNTYKRVPRNSSIEVVKLLALVLIIFSSVLPYGPTYQGGFDSYVDIRLAEFSMRNIVYTLFRWCGQFGDALFIVCSAYFLCDSKKFKAPKIYKMILDSWIISVLGLVTAMLFMSPTFSESLKSLFPITFQRSWFVGCYIIYYLAHPFINNAVSNLNRAQFRRVVVILFILYSVLTMFGTYYYFTLFVSFICIHLFVMYNKKYELFKHSDKKDIITIVVSLSLILLWIVGINYLGSRYSFFTSKTLLFCHYYNPLVIAIALSALNLAVRRQWKSEFVNKITALSLLIYLFHSSYFWLTYGKYWIYDRMSELGLPWYVSTFILIVAYVLLIPTISFLYDITIGKLTSGVFSKAVGFVMNKIDIMLSKII